MSTAAEAWATAKGSPPRSSFVQAWEQGYEQGAFDERERVTSFLADNMTTITEFAGPRTVEMLAYMFREMAPGPRVGRVS